MIFRQLFDHDSHTYSYLLGDPTSKQAILIDPVLEQLDRDLQLLEELGLDLVYSMETHVHADHITSAFMLQQVTGCDIVYPEGAGARNVNREIRHQEVLTIGDHHLTAIATPGHTDAHMAYFIEDRVFSGDALFVRGCGRTDFQEGNPGTLYDVVTQRLFTLPAQTLVYPAHDYNGHTCSTIAEEQQFNPRYCHHRESFIHLMQNLNLPMPRKIQYAVPLNLTAGDV